MIGVAQQTAGLLGLPLDLRTWRYLLLHHAHPRPHARSRGACSLILILIHAHPHPHAPSQDSPLISYSSSIIGLLVFTLVREVPAARCSYSLHDAHTPSCSSSMYSSSRGFASVHHHPGTHSRRPFLLLARPAHAHSQVQDGTGVERRLEHASWSKIETGWNAENLAVRTLEAVCTL